MVFHRINAYYQSKHFIWILAGIGIVERLFQYFVNRSLWLDEAALASNILSRSYLDLLKPLAYRQLAPVGFLLIERLFVDLIGKHEYALRLFPLICGILSIFLFISICKNILSANAAVVAIALFVISNHMIYFSSEAKQYSCDAMVTLAMLAITFHMLSHGFSKQNIALLAIAGAAAIWFSFPVVFVLGGISVGLSFMCLSQTKANRLYPLLPAFTLWALSFAANYILILSRFMYTGSQVKGFHRQLNAFMPFPPTSIEELKWLPRALALFVRNPCGFDSIGIVIVIISIIGCISCFKSRKPTAIVLLSPAILALVASALRLYPFTGRLVLYLAPVMFILVAEGTLNIFNNIKGCSNTTAICIVALVFYSAAGACLVKPVYREEFRSMLSYLQTNRQEEDAVYFHQNSRRFLDCYIYTFQWLPETNYILGKQADDYIESFKRDVKALDGKNSVWFIFCHTEVGKKLNDVNFALYHLDKIGVQKQKLQRKGASIYLYDLSK